MGHVVILGVFVADTAYRAERMPIIGETVLGNSFSLGPGGKGSNQAVAAGRLGVKVSMISRLGKDDFGQMALETWKSSGVTPYIEEDKDSYTGAAYMFIEESTGDNAIIISPGAAANISPEDLENKKDLIVNADVFITQLEQPIEAAKKGLEIARSAGVKTILNPAPAVKLPNEILSLCDFITPNETETETLTGVNISTLEDADSACKKFVEMGVKNPIITLGEKGLFYSDGKEEIYMKASSDKAVDTTGAGDAFNGAFSFALFKGKKIKDCLEMANKVAGLSTTKLGAGDGMPFLKDLS